MAQVEKKRYKLAPGTQVRKEDFGLLFYTMAGPRLYFLPSGDLLADHFFNGAITLKQGLKQETSHVSISSARVSSLVKALHQLKEKGVILEC